MLDTFPYQTMSKIYDFWKIYFISFYPQMNNIFMKILVEKKLHPFLYVKFF